MIRKLAIFAAGALGLGLASFVGPTAAHAQDIFNVTASPYNASSACPATVDDESAIQAAFTAAGTDYANTGVVPEVYFPAGCYSLGNPDGSTTSSAIVINDSTFPVDIIGDGRASTTIYDCLEGTASAHGATVFELGDGGNISQTNTGADGSEVEKLDINSMPCGSSQYGGGDLVHNFTNNTTLNWLYGEAPVSSSTDDPNVFGFRTTADCNNSNGPASSNPTVYHFGNTVSNVTTVGYGLGGAVDVDVSCQENDTITHITDTGAGVALYKDADTTLSNYTYLGKNDQEHAMSWYVQAPSTGMTVTGVTATGTGAAGNVTGDGTGVDTNTNLTLKSIVATDSGDSLLIEDANGVTTGSGDDVYEIDLKPQTNLNNLDWLGSQPTVITCGGTGTITNLVGLTCP